MLGSLCLQLKFVVNLNGSKKIKPIFLTIATYTEQNKTEKVDLPPSSSTSPLLFNKQGASNGAGGASQFAAFRLNWGRGNMLISISLQLSNLFITPGRQQNHS